MTKVLAFIGARGGSKGLLKKNLRLLAGKPLISYSIIDAKSTSLVDKVVVATDDKEIAETAKAYGAEVPFLLPHELCIDNAKIEPVMKYVMEELEKKENYKTDILVYLQSTDFFRKPEWIDWCVQKLIRDHTVESAFAAQNTHKRYWQKINETYVRLRDSDKYYGPRQMNTGSVYREDTGIASALRPELIKQGLRTGDNVRILRYEGPFIDVHTEFDLWLVEKIMMEWKK